VNFESGRIAAGAAPVAGKKVSQISHAKLRVRLHASLLLLDCLCVVGGIYLVSLLYLPPEEKGLWAIPAAVLWLIYLGVALNSRAYAAEILHAPSMGATRAIRSLAIAAGGVIMVAFLLKTSDIFSRVTLVAGALCGVVLLSIVRGVFLSHARRILGGNPYSVTLIKDGEQQVSHDGFSLVISADELIDPSQDCPIAYDRLAMMLNEADRVVVACPPERRESWVSMLKGANIRSEIFAPELGAIAPLGMSRWNSAPTIVVADGPLSTFDAAIKRIFDVVTSGLALVALSPLFLLTAIAIVLESPGSVFFVQTRIGQGNRQFRMYKFRSMRSDMLDASASKLISRDDARLTRVGAFIRKTSIDELPQLLNVLLGQMSIVGPRPHAPGAKAANKLYWEVDQRYWHRHAAKPGLTGLAQVRGYRGATEVEQDLTDRLQADLEYLNHWSIWKDLKIILMTFGVLVHNKAY
jgi:exopolysaccharide biosynthesis polyprenyl glycosylphosphotransferase